MSNKEVVGHLNRLITTCQDAEDGYNHAAESVDNVGLQKTLHDYAQERANMKLELQNFVQQMGEDPEDDGSAIASLHRTWMDVKSAFTSMDESAIVRECVRGEESACDTYEQELDEEYPEQIRQVLRAQYERFRAAVTHLKAEQRRLEAVES